MLKQSKHERKKIDIKTLEDCLCDGETIQEILDKYGCFETLRVDALKQSYRIREDERLQCDFKVYCDRKTEEFREKMRKCYQS